MGSKVGRYFPGSRFRLDIQHLKLNISDHPIELEEHIVEAKEHMSCLELRSIHIHKVLNFDRLELLCSTKCLLDN